MLTLKRRDILAGGAATLLSAGAAAGASAVPTALFFTVYSPNILQARRLAQKAAHSSTAAIPLTGDLVALWKTRLSKNRGALHGFTSWSDFVLLRGLAEEQGLRVRAETRLDAGKTMFRWVMA